LADAASFKLFYKETILYDRQRLIELVHQNALQFGDFTLASGKKASYYLDCRKLTLDSEAANVIAEGILETLESDMPETVGGMAIGADPITAAVIAISWRQGKPLKGFIVRKEAKLHGTGKQVEGPVKPGQRAVMMEDVITTGGSSLKAIEHAREFGLVVDRIVTIVDRGDDSAAIFEKVGVKFHSLLHVSDLGV